jgi:hypothetical protein
MSLTAAESPTQNDFFNSSVASIKTKREQRRGAKARRRYFCID